MSKKLLSVLAALAIVVSGLALYDREASAVPIGDPAFERTWARTDQPVAEDQAERTWIWGPEALRDVQQEEYAESPGGMRTVQYFDKSRMEINDPTAPEDSLWYVTNGLLVVEMVDGKFQIGDAEFDELPDPAPINITGDPGDEEGLSPTYADINRYGLRETPATAVGTVLTTTIDADGTIGDDPTKAELNVTAAERVTVAGIDHTVASVFWEFMTSSGTVYEDGAYVTDILFENPYYATGFPITEAYWSSVMVNGSERDVLWQCFERRCLTYTPGNPEGFLVEAANVGQHYYRWRYELSVATPTPGTPTETATPSETATETETVTGTPTGTETVTGTPTETETVTGTPTETETVTETSTMTETATETSTATETVTETSTATETETGTATETETEEAVD